MKAMDSISDMKQRRTDKSCAETQEEIGKKNQVKALDSLFMGGHLKCTCSDSNMEEETKNFV